MKFSIARETLLKPLQVVSSVVEKRQTLPILANVLVQTGNGQLVLTGTDLEVELTAKLDIPDIDEGEITLPARKFVDICRTLPDEAVLEISVKDGKALIRSGKSRFSLATLPATEFPATENIAGVAEFEVEQGQLKKLIEQTQFCMAVQDVRYYLNGLLLEVESHRLRTVATDGHRLALCDLDVDIGDVDKQQVIIPRKGILELGRLLEATDEPCQIKMSTNHVKVSVAGITMTSKLIDGRFPDYERVVPQQGEIRVVADRDALRQALTRASILSNEKYRGIRLQLAKDSLRATVNNPEQEEAEEELEVSYEGPEFEIGFNVAYLADALGAIRTDVVEINLTDANSSCLIWGTDDHGSRYVVMPMRL